MNTFLTINEAAEISRQLREKGKRIVLSGGCFDILHRGHIDFLTEAKKQGDILFVMIESDENIKRIKGEHRPYQTQQDRAYILSHLKHVDYVILLPQLNTDDDYDQLIFAIKPDIIATTKGDTGRVHKERQAEKIKAKIVDVIDLLPHTSTSRLAKLLQNEV